MLLTFFCTCSSLLLGTLFSTRCGSTLLSSVIHHGVLDLRLLCLIVDSPLSSTELLASCLQERPVWPSSPSVPTLLHELCSLSGVSACECVRYAPRAPNSHRLRNVVPWFRQGLAPRRGIPRPTHVLCMVWESPAPLSNPPRAARVEGVSRARLLWFGVLLGMVVGSAVPSL